MRSLYLFALTVVFFVVSCSKSNNNGDSGSLAGDWRLTAYYGGFAQIHVQVPDDSMVVLSLHKDSTFQKLVNRQIMESGSYHTSIGIGGDSAWHIIFANNGPNGLYTVNKDTLLISELPYDGLEYRYLRLH